MMLENVFGILNINKMEVSTVYCHTASRYIALFWCQSLHILATATHYIVIFQ